ncbi:FBP domain-containing protein [Catenuloplanes japonicus]|uniref:FBP domain-containing protein n=1 Tax=Catenuloplanes japonicus TaxID=33876 RepID=UPI000524BA09|nr:FBP domain-containing protein [Catenuloplanes japonicus]
MRPLTEREIRAAFVNCSKGEATRLSVPRDLPEQPWDDLDFLGWRDPKAPDRAYLVTESADGVVAITLRVPAPSAARTARRGMCAFCLTVHDGGVPLMVAPKAGKAGRQGDSVGTYICGDLACSLYVRGRKDAGAAGRMHESLSAEEKSARVATNVATFIARIKS